MTENKLIEIAEKWLIGTTKQYSRVESKPLGNGLINDTFEISRNGDPNSYVLQRINHKIFRNVDLMQNNIKRITDHIRNKLIIRGESDIERKVLTPLSTLEGKNYYFDGENYWRMTLFIKDSITHESVTPELSYITGKAFGEFQYMLSDLPGEPLGYSIPNFHNMEFRIGEFKEAIAKDRAGRLSGEENIYCGKIVKSIKVKELASELIARQDEMCTAVRLISQGKLPLRVTHCDTKVNNMLFDRNGTFLCVIDLDTAMPGTVLSDFGDFIRTAGNNAAEDEKDTLKISLNMRIFESFSKGYIESTKAFLSEQEKELLPFGAKMMTYMQTIRFFTDYLNGDIYYKTFYPTHNWVRSIAQRTLLIDIDRHYSEMSNYIKVL